jgi:hypothetical protein
MFASRRNAGFSSAGPVSRFVIVASQMSRSSYERPRLSSASRPGAAAAHSSSVSVSSAYV